MYSRTDWTCARGVAAVLLREMADVLGVRERTALEAGDVRVRTASLERAMRVFIYWNVHRGCWSIRACEGPERGRVINYASSFDVRDARFKVSEAGRQRVIASGHKAVHAGIEGELAAVMYVGNHGRMATPVKPMRGGLRVKYHPHLGPHFIVEPDWGPTSGAPLVRGFHDRTVLACNPVLIF